MFVEDVVSLPLSVPVVRDRLLDLSRGSELREAAVGGFRAGESVLAGAGFAGLPEQIELRMVSAFRRGSGVVIPVRWILCGPEKDLAPPLDADLELSPNPDGTCRLILRGSYRPPVGRLGATVDWLLLRRVARASTQGFLSRLGRAIRQPPAPGEAVTPDRTVGPGTPSLRADEPRPSATVAGQDHEPARMVGALLQVLDSAARFAVRSIGDARWAGVTVRFAGEPCTVAYTDNRVLDLDGAQYASRTGPALTGMRKDQEQAGTVEQVRAPWLQWASAAEAAGVRSFRSVPLHAGGRPVGCLTLYSARPQGLRDPNPGLLATLIEHLETALADYQATQDGDDAAVRLQGMLQDRWVTHSAIGVLMANHTMSAAAATANLSGQAKTRGITLRVAAQDILVRHSARALVPSQGVHDPERAG